jgi:hypothetical protein
MRQRIWMLYFLPFLALIIWQVIVLLGSGTTDPQWVVSAEGQEFSQCSDAINIDGFDADRDVQLGDAAVSLPDSYNAARDVLSDAPRFSFSGLAEVTLPDDERRLVWAHVLVMDDGGPTNVVYVDVNTADALVLVTDVVVNDAFFAGCQLLAASEVDAIFDKWQPGIYMVAYALAMLGALGFVHLLDKFRARRARSRE